ncbi:F-box protein At3g07870-like [Papaver somniferum]|uniref:F-box protein At3g07870-like n=1 Tax=Papaver somniferum TaxID=3469 RepID=UPI000E6F53FC|nr:F-box protein At3g07870-like [Papaver somniferum]
MRNLLQSAKMGILFSIVLCEEGRASLCYRECDDNDPDKEHFYRTLVTKSKTDHPPINMPYRSCTKVMVGSCNVLVCFSIPHHGIDDPIYICNPYTREYVNLPGITEKDGLVVSGFGYHQVTNEYKVVRIYNKFLDQASAAQIEVYTLGSSHGWRKIGKVACQFLSSPGILVDGALHWLDRICRTITAFDLVDEEFKLILSPPCLNNSGKYSSYRLHEVGGHLCVVHKEPSDRVDIWLLKMTGRNKLCDSSMNRHDSYDSSWSWCKEFSIAWQGLNKCEDYEPFALLKNNNVLLWYNRAVLCCYDLEAKTFKKLMGDAAAGDLKYFQAIPHKNTIVSLKALGEKSKLRKCIEINEW